MSKQNQSESILEFEMQEFETVPPGQYIAIFKDVQKTHHQQWGDGVMFLFEIASGEYKGQTVARIGKPSATNQNATGKMIAGILGSYSPGQMANLRPYVGRPYNVLVEPTQGGQGKTRIGQVWAYQRAQSAPAAPQPTQPELDDIPF